MICGKPATEVGPISWRGRCRPCGLERETASIVEQAQHAGPIFDYWRERMAACVGGVLLDETPPPS